MKSNIRPEKSDLSLRYYQIGGITIQWEASFPVNEKVVDSQLELFRLVVPLTSDIVKLKHHFPFPDLNQYKVKKNIYKRAPWIISELEDGWLYKGISSLENDEEIWEIAHFNHDHSLGNIYHKDSKPFEIGGLHSLSFTITDQILVSRLLADRMGCLIHSAAMIIDGKGFVFVGHSEAGKSTTVSLLREHGVILCDDRNIIRKMDGTYRVYGTWSHGTVTDLSPLDAPLKAIFFIEKAKKNSLSIINDKKYIWEVILACIIKPLATSDWWDKMFNICEDIIFNIPVYRLEIDKDDDLYETIKSI